MNYTALHHSAYFNECEMFSWLIQHGADVHATDKNSKTALHIAAKYGSATVVRQLLLEGVDPNKVDRLKRKPAALTSDRTGAAVVGSKKLTQSDLRNVDRVFKMWSTIKDVYDRKGVVGLEGLKFLGGEIGDEADEFLKLIQAKPRDAVGKSEALSEPTPEPASKPKQFIDKGAPEVFVSYCWADKTLVRSMAEQIQKCGYNVWLDVGQMGGGDELFEQIDTGIRGCKVMICCVSERYAKSLNCRREVSLACDLKKPIIPIIANPAAAVTWPPVGPMGFLLTGKLYVDLANDYNANFEQLTESLEKFL